MVRKRGNNKFENDVKMYGTQATAKRLWSTSQFENDVKMYGTQADARGGQGTFRLRMM